MPKDLHLTPVELLALYSEELAPGRRREILAHLAGGCCQCAELALKLPWPNVSAALQEASDSTRRDVLEAVLDFRIRSVVKGTLGMVSLLSGARNRAKEELQGRFSPECLRGRDLPTQALLWARASEWLERARALRRDDLEACLLASVGAVLFASNLEVGAHPEAEAENLQALAWGELGNARRLVGDFVGAEAALAKGIGRMADSRPAADLAVFAGRYLQAVRKFPEADQFYAWAQQVHSDCHDSHAAGRICLLRGLNAGYAQDHQRAMAFFLQSLQLLDLPSDPCLSLSAFHNVIQGTALLGHFDVAQEWLERCAPMYEEHGGAMDLLRRRWVEGFIEAGLGNLPRADGLLRGVRQDFEDRDLSYQAALVTLDLCTVWLRRGKFRELACGVEEAVSTFTALKIGREALAGLLLLQEAARAEQATVALIQAAAGALRAERP